MKESHITKPVADALAVALAYGSPLPPAFGRDEGGLHLKFDAIEFALIPTGGAVVKLRHGEEVVWSKELRNVLQAHADQVELGDILGGMVRIDVSQT